MAKQQLIHVVPSLISDATSTFNACVKPRFVDLRATRKDLSKAFDTFILRQRNCAAAVPTAVFTASEEEINFELEFEMIDTDMDRVFYAMNLNNWIHGVHDVLDPNNDFDREMVGNMASYVNKHFATNSFFGPPSQERQEKSILMSREEILPPKITTSSARKHLRFNELLQQPVPEVTGTVECHVSTPKDPFNVSRVPPQEVPTLPLNATSASAVADTFALTMSRAFS